QRRVAAADRGTRGGDLDVLEGGGTPADAQVEHAIVPGELRRLLDATGEKPQPPALPAASFDGVVFVGALHLVDTVPAHKHFRRDPLLAAAEEHEGRGDAAASPMAEHRDLVILRARRHQRRRERYQADIRLRWFQRGEIFLAK